MLLWQPLKATRLWPNSIQPENHFFKIHLMEKRDPICYGDSWVWCTQQYCGFCLGYQKPWFYSVTLVFCPQWALHPSCQVKMPQPTLPCRFQKPANKQGDTSSNCSFKLGELAKSPEKIKHSELDMSSPCPFGYQTGICWSHSHSTWTYRSFVLYRRTANRLAIRCHTPAVSRVGMALHLFDKTKSRHFISHSVTHHYCYSPAP